MSAVIPQVAIIMGSDSDLPIMKDAAVVLKNFDVPFEVELVSTKLWFGDNICGKF